MNTRIVITDLTRMHGRRVCIAGYTGKKQCVRPVLPPPGIPESCLYKDGKAIIYPFALVELDLLGPAGEPPHTEDQVFNPDSVHFVREVHSRESVLDWSLFESIESLFEQPIHDDLGFYLIGFQGPRSLGTIHPSQISQVIYAKGIEEDAWDYRLSFTDKAGKSYRLKITDLTWHYYCDSLRNEIRDPSLIAAELTESLRNLHVYLRIGLARGWKKFPDRCYLQITGVYTFPDFLKGKNFSDLVYTRGK
jgi:hypothetical protein